MCRTPYTLGVTCSFDIPARGGVRRACAVLSSLVVEPFAAWVSSECRGVLRHDLVVERALPIGRKCEISVSGSAEFFGCEEFRDGGIKRGRLLMGGTLPQCRPAKAVFCRVPNEQ